MTIPLMRDLIDDAGLFPPARLPMTAAVERHRADERAGHPMLTHRFLCPASRWDELLAALDPHERAMRVGLILDAAPPAAPDPRCVIEQAEIAVRPGAALPVGLPWPVFVEPVRGRGWLDRVAELADRGLGAKVRCGGADSQAFPSPAELVGFIRSCVAAGVPIKAVARVVAGAPVQPRDCIMPSPTSIRLPDFATTAISTCSWRSRAWSPVRRFRMSMLQCQTPFPYEPSDSSVMTWQCVPGKCWFPMARVAPTSRSLMRLL